ncbi:hypothetical protein [Granulicella sp. WH15]|uniref:hypothetical protein n=1 Tax=Granulicella sp. WH15 TaxID=2602070 RepID=UPI002105FB07|nr:hypothetical protein [Granulicella sp. WH15]
MRKLRRFVLFSFLLFACLLTTAQGQGNYEIQVYGSDTLAPKNLMVELHSNYTISGQTKTIDGVYPTNHQEHETLELTQGINNWSEVGFYVFTSEQDGHGVQWVGDHIRPRVRAPDSWHLPVGLSLSTEIGYQRAVYSPDTWTWELRPIIDKAIGRWYLALNPALERTWHGPDVSQGIGFSPGAKIGYDFTKKISGGVEYYADYGRIGRWDSLHEQQQQIFAVTDLNVSPNWEINFGIGVGPTAATDHLIVKAIIGRRFDWGKKKSEVQ